MSKKKNVSLKMSGSGWKSTSEDNLWRSLIMKNGYNVFLLQKSLSVYRISEESLSLKVMDHQLMTLYSYRNTLGLSIIITACNYILYVLEVALRRFKFMIFNWGLFKKS